MRELTALPMERVGLSEKKLQKSKNPVWPVDDAIPGWLAYLAGYLLLRASPAAAKSARSKLEAFWKRLVDAEALVAEESMRGALDLALHGMAGAKRVLADSDWQYVYWWGFVDDADMIATRYGDSAKSEFDPDPRLAWLGGEKILELSCSRKLVRGVGTRKHAYFEQMAKFDHPAVAAMMEEWREDKRGGAIAQAYLGARKQPVAAKVAKKPAAKKPAAKKPVKKRK